MKSADTSIFRDYDKPIGELVCDREFVRRFCHSIYLDIEIQAMEVCGRNIIGYRQMPVDFKLDMARQIWDEGRHAMMLKRR
ncbi:MAG TPA: hypothetical protein VHR66_18385, partial [Gemmataceae bacterium]|nr:hypothetical protein [Gemmataceae bacterium]